MLPVPAVHHLFEDPGRPCSVAASRLRPVRSRERLRHVVLVECAAREERFRHRDRHRGVVGVTKIGWIAQEVLDLIGHRMRRAFVYRAERVADGGAEDHAPVLLADRRRGLRVLGFLSEPGRSAYS